MLKYTSKLELYTQNQEVVEKTLKKLNIQYIQPEGTFYIFPKIPEDLDEMTFCETMAKNNIIVVPGSAFGEEGFYRMSLCLLPETLKKGMEQFEIAYQKTLEEMGYNKDKKEDKKSQHKVVDVNDPEQLNDPDN